MTSAAPKPIPGCIGYRVHPDGTVETEWKFRGRGRGQTPEHYLSDQWKPLKPYQGRVTLQTSNGGKVWKQVNVLVRDLF